MSAVAFQPISHYGVIGNMHSAALVAKNGSIDWACLPEMDSPSVFGGLLDDEKGGHFRVWVPDASAQQQTYVSGTNVLLTRFGTENGIGEVEDFMPIPTEHGGSSRSHAIVRILRAVRGEARFRVECRPAFDYARQKHVVLRDSGSVRFETPRLCLELDCPRHLRSVDGGVTGEVVLSGGESVALVLTVRRDGHVGAEDIARNHKQELGKTIAYWRNWIARASYRGRWRAEVERSALVLKLLTHAPSGGIAAAVTASLPEVLGGESNWDYRFCWVRDACWTTDVFMRLGFHQEARAFMRFLNERREEGNRSRRPLDVMYSLSGTPLDEVNLEHLAGYEGSRPVRIGNAAANQMQLDVYGEYVRAVLLYDQEVERVSDPDWNWLRGMADWLAEHASDPDAGVWEKRGEPEHFVHSKIQAWSALDNLLRLAQRRGLPFDVPRIRTARDRVYEDILNRGYDSELGTFTRAYDSDSLDAALLFLEQSGLMAPSDPRFASTLERLRLELVEGSALMRRKPEEQNDFCICSFWLIEVLARNGRHEQARELFERMLTYANHLGLYSEEIRGDGDLIGNFPQALTHLGLIRAAIALDGAT